MFYKDRIEELEDKVKSLTEKHNISQEKIMCMEKALDILGYKPIISEYYGARAELEKWDALLKYLGVGFKYEQARVVCKKTEDIHWEGWVKVPISPVASESKKKSKK